MSRAWNTYGPVRPDGTGRGRPPRERPDRTGRCLFPWVLACLAILACASCARHPAPPPDGSRLGLPLAFSRPGGGIDPERPWWLDMNSPELNRLMDQALGSNPGLREAQARLDQALAVARAAGALRSPQVDLSGGAMEERFPATSLGREWRDTLYLDLAASYELDLWGRLRAGESAAMADALARREDLRAAVMTLTASIGSLWISLIELERKAGLLNEQLAATRDLLDLVETRAALGLATAVDVLQQRQSVAAVEAARIDVQGQIRLRRHELALLCGRPATWDPEVGTRRFPWIPETPPAGLPADLLVMRPDLRAAALRLQAAGWRLEEARAALLPRIRLTGGLNMASDSLALLFDNWLLSLAAGLTAPLRDGGRLRAEVERGQAREDELLAAYGRQALEAIREVEDALASEERLRAALAKKQEQARISAETLERAGYRYLNGHADFLPVLREQLNLIALRLDSIGLAAELRRNRIALHRALGGAWPAALARRPLAPGLWITGLELRGSRKEGPAPQARPPREEQQALRPGSGSDNTHQPGQEPGMTRP